MRIIQRKENLALVHNLQHQNKEWSQTEKSLTKFKTKLENLEHNLSLNQ
jgi:hypothetical protein